MALTEKEQEIEKNIVFIEKNLNLNSAFKFLQTIYKQNRLITLIGELHNKSWTCNPPHIDISQYCVDRVSNNNNCRILLEYHPSIDPTTLGSEAIRTTYTALSRMNIAREYIIPYDYRTYFLGHEMQYILYQFWDTNISYNNIKSKLINPYFEKFQGVFELYDSYDPNIGFYLTQTYIQDINNHFLSILNNISSKEPKNHIRLELMQVWKKVADFFILREVLRNDDINEYIVIMGNKHLDNLRIILEKISNEINYQEGNSQNCVKLLHPFTFD